MMNKGNINKITNNYILKSLFAYLKYEKILKLIKNNKGLQNRLGINLNNYKEIFNFPKYEYTKSVKIVEKRNIRGDLQWTYFFIILIITCITCIFFIYSLIYSILLVTMDFFEDNNSEENFKKSSVNIIKKINACTFILDLVILATPFLLLIFIFNQHEKDYGLKKYIKIFIIIIINLTHFSFEGLIIWKLVLSNNVIKGSAAWFMIMDYFFIFLNFFYILYLVFSSYLYFAYCGANIETKTEIELISFNDIKINNFILPKNFMNWKIKERKKYVLNNYRYLYIFFKPIILFRLVKYKH